MASLIRSEIARVLLEEVSDPSLKDVVITDVKLTGDFKTAKIFYTRGSADLKEIRRGIDRARPFLRRKLGENLEMRVVPELEFEVDTHGEKLGRLMNLFDEVNRKDSGGEPEQE